MRMACSGWTSCTRSDSNESQSPGSLIGASRNGTHGGGLRMLSIRVGFSLLAVAAAGWGQEVSEKIEFFESRIRPILANNCYSCHSENKLGGLRVDSRVALLAGGKSGPAIVPGRPDESLLIQAILQADPKKKMPPAGNKLKDKEIADLRYWIQAMSAFWPEEITKPNPAPAQSPKFTLRPQQRNFWSFQPVRRPPIPVIRDAIWAKTPVDHFILAK